MIIIILRFITGSLFESSVFDITVMLVVVDFEGGKVIGVVVKTDIKVVAVSVVGIFVSAAFVDVGEAPNNRQCFVPPVCPAA